MNKISILDELNILENLINEEKCLINILNEHCGLKEFNSDTELCLIINQIDKNNLKIFNNLENIIERVSKEVN